MSIFNEEVNEEVSETENKKITASSGASIHITISGIAVLLNLI
jgi:hypothetical protein